MRIYNPNREERAFIYQEAQGLEALIKDLGSLSVMIEETAPKSGQGLATFRVTFLLAPESVGMKVQATDHNIYNAIVAAKEVAQQQLNAIVNALPQQRKPGTKANQPPSQLLH